MPEDSRSYVSSGQRRPASAPPANRRRMKSTVFDCVLVPEQRSTAGRELRLGLPVEPSPALASEPLPNSKKRVLRSTSRASLTPPSRASRPADLSLLATVNNAKKKNKEASFVRKSIRSQGKFASAISSASTGSPSHRSRKRALSNEASTADVVACIPAVPSSNASAQPTTSTMLTPTSRGIKRPRLSSDKMRHAQAADRRSSVVQARVSCWVDAQTQTESADLLARSTSTVTETPVEGGDVSDGEDSEPCEEPFEDLFIDFEMISLNDALAVPPELALDPWVPVSGCNSVYVPPGVQQLISDMRFLLESQRKLCERAQRKYTQELHCRLALQAEVARLKSELALDARRERRRNSGGHL